MGDILGRIFDLAVGIFRRRHGSGLRYGARVVIEPCDHLLLHVDPQTRHMVGGEREASRWSTFVIVGPGDANRTQPGRKIKVGSVVGFRSLATGRFVGLNFDDRKTLACSGSQVRVWESFKIGHGNANQKLRKHVSYGTYISLAVRQTDAGKWWHLQYHRDTSRKTYADRESVDLWETFALLDPQTV